MSAPEQMWRPSWGPPPSVSPDPRDTEIAALRQQVTDLSARFTEAMKAAGSGRGEARRADAESARLHRVLARSAEETRQLKNDLRNAERDAETHKATAVGIAEDVARLREELRTKTEQLAEATAAPIPPIPFEERYRQSFGVTPDEARADAAAKDAARKAELMRDPRTR